MAYSTTTMNKRTHQKMSKPAALDIRDAAHAWRVLLTSADATEADRNRFREWLGADPRHKAAYERAVTVWNALGEIPREEMPARLWRRTLRNQFLARFRTTPFPSFSIPFRVASGVAAFSLAAVVAGGLVMAILRTNIDSKLDTAPVIESYSSGPRETRAIVLTDGTEVTLGAGTEIETAFSGRAREVRLVTGAVLVDVEPDAERPFSVNAGALTATALGTEFDVRNSGGVYRVAVAEGRVEVRYPFVVNGRALDLPMQRSLSAGEQVAAEEIEGLGEVRPISPEKVGAWRHARLVYDSATIAEIVADANRFDDRHIAIASGSEFIADLRVTGSFNFEDVASIFATLTDIHPIAFDQSEPGAVKLRAVSGDRP